MNTIRELNARGEREILETLCAGAHAFLALVESWPNNGKLATFAGMANTHEGLRRVLAELRASLADDDTERTT
jgi:hypothetical protein